MTFMDGANKSELNLIFLFSINLLGLIESPNKSGPQPPSTELFSLDVPAMFQSFPDMTEYGQDPEVQTQALERAGCMGGARPGLVDWITRVTLTSNTFEFDSELNTQQSEGLVSGRGLLLVCRGVPRVCGEEGAGQV